MKSAIDGAAALTPGGTSRSRLLHIPVFHKILFAHLALVVGIVAASTALAIRFLSVDSAASTFGVFLFTATAAAAASVPFHALLLRLALAPVKALQDTAERIESGDFEARAQLPPFADPQLERLTGVFNRLVDSMVSDRRRLRETAARAFHAQEAERARLARELQGETSQGLAAVLLRLSAARRAESPEARAALLDEARAVLADVTGRISRFALGLHAPALEDLGVVAAVEGFARSIVPPAGPAVEIDADDLRGALDRHQELALFRVVQEALSNAVAHASASRLRVRFARQEKGVEVAVEDDGCGFLPEELQAREPCLGLFGMRERALYVGGSLMVESRPGGGTRVRVRIPFEPPADRERLQPPPLVA